jgi:hypothetical protein
MMNPTSNAVHVDRLLTNISIGYKNPDYIADNLFPMVPVTKRSDIVPKYDQSHWFRNAAVKRAPGTKSEGGGYKVDTTDTYYAHRYSFRSEIDDDTRENADAPFNLDRESTEFVTDKMLMAREVNFATNFFTTSKWGADKTGGSDFTVWSNYGSSSPLVDVDAYKDTAEAKIARELRTGVIGKQVWLQLKWHPDLVDTIKYTQKGQVSVDLAASLMELDNLYVGRAIQTTSNEGVAESSVVYSRIWGKHMLLLYVPKSPSLMTPAAGYNFVWKSQGLLQYIKRMRDEEREVDIIEGNSYFDQKKTAANAGVFLSGAVA